MVLDTSKINIIFNLEGIFNWESKESVISPNFVLVSKFYSAFWHNMTIIFNSVNCNLQTIELSKVSGDKACIWVLLFSASKRISLLRRFGIILCCIIIITLRLFWNDVNVNLIRISREKTLNWVECLKVLVIQCREVFEFKISWGSPVETLFRELVLVRECNTKTYIVVLLCTIDTAPKE
jgi:hypothetical protein